VITPEREATSVRTPDDQRDEALQKLQQMLEEAVDAGADSIELEYVAEGLEVMYVLGSTSSGDVIGDRVLASGIIRLIIDRAKLARRSRGVMNWTLLGKQYNIMVEEYDSFGESAFRLTLGKPRQKRS
jgi:hypothetical protein